MTSERGLSLYVQVTPMTMTEDGFPSFWREEPQWLTPITTLSQLLVLAGSSTITLACDSGIVRAKMRMSDVYKRFPSVMQAEDESNPDDYLVVSEQLPFCLSLNFSPRPVPTEQTRSAFESRLPAFGRTEAQLQQIEHVSQPACL